MLLTKVHKVLLGLLVVQVLLTVIVLTRGNRNAVVAETPILAGFDAAKISRVQIFATGADKPGIELAKRGNDWVLASGFDFPVDAKKVNDLLTPIAKMAAAEPIATSTSRHKQLRVGDKEFERKLVLTADGKDTTVYIGSSAGLRRNAIRIGGSDDVYAVGGVSSYMAGTEPTAWITGRYVDLQADAIQSVTVQRPDGTNIQLAHGAPTPVAPGPGSGSGSGAGSGAGSGSGAITPPTPSPATPVWDASIGGTPITLAAGEVLSSSEIERLANSVATIDLVAPADPKRDASAPTATITIAKKADKTPAAPIILDVILDGTRYWVHERTNPKAIYVDKARIDDLVNVTRDKIVKKPPPPAPPGAGSGSGSGTGSGDGEPPAPPMPMPMPPGPPSR